MHARSREYEVQVPPLDQATGSETADLVGARVAGGDRGVEAVLGELGTQGGGGGRLPQVGELQGIAFEVVQLFCVSEARRAAAAGASHRLVSSSSASVGATSVRILAKLK